SLEGGREDVLGSGVHPAGDVEVFVVVGDSDLRRLRGRPAELGRLRDERDGLDELPGRFVAYAVETDLALETRHADEGSGTTRSIGGQLLLDTPFGTCIRLGTSGVLLRLFGGLIGVGTARGRQARQYQEYLGNPSRCDPEPGVQGSPHFSRR